MRTQTGFIPAALLCGSLLGLAGCSDGSGDPSVQIGPNPVLPNLQQYLIPPMHIAKVIGWKKGETPSVAQGLKIEPLATGLQQPRALYTLPNGDVLVVESKAPKAPAPSRPKDIVLGYVESWATSGGQSGPSNRITLNLPSVNGALYSLKSWMSSSPRRANSSERAWTFASRIVGNRYL